MNRIMRVCWILFVSIFLITACGKKEPDKQEQKTADAGEQQVLDSELAFVTQAGKLKKAGKADEALTLLDKGLEKYPLSKRLIAGKFGIYRSEKRYKEGLEMLGDLIPKMPEEAGKRFTNASIDLMLPLMREELKAGNIEKAAEYLKRIADAGYRGFHQFRRNPIYEPLRKLPEFDGVMDKISETTGIGKPAPDFTTTMRNGESFTLSEQKGKVVLVDIWSTSCPPCVKEIPNLKKIYDSKKENGFEIISISLDDDEEKVNQFLTQHPMTWKTVFSGKGWKDPVAKLYKVSWIPSLWLVDKKGVLRYFDYRGEDLKAAIEELLNES